jgi:ArsR family transcriptional regulator, arsenate/arsenite/antimonite-responsive transcriptional repressor
VTDRTSLKWAGTVKAGKSPGSALRKAKRRFKPNGSDITSGIPFMRRGKDTPDDTDAMVALFKALSDPSRLRLVKLLASRVGGKDSDGCGAGPLCVNALAERLKITQSAVSQHLRVLRHVGLVRGSRKGAFVHYSVDLDGLEQGLQALRGSLGIARSRR